MKSIRRTRLGVVSGLSACLLVLGVLTAAPALAAGCSYNSGNGTITVTADNTNANVLKRSGDDITFNGASCGAGVTDVDTINIVGGPGTSADTVTIDISGGKFAPGLNNLDNQGQAEIEITVNLGSGTNNVIIAGSETNDKFTFRALGVDLNSDGDADVTGPVSGNTYFALTSAEAGSPAVTVNGLGGGDTFVQTDKTKETLNGGTGLDRIEYKARTAAVTVEPVTAANDGETGEADTVAEDIETIYGGSGNDTLTGNAATNYLYGGAGNDTLNGLDGGDVLNGGTGVTSTTDDGQDTLNGGNGADALRGGANIDTLNGEAGGDNLVGGAGNDTENGGAGRDFFDQEAAANGADVINGAAGGDQVSYSRRAVTVTVTLDGTANDGASGEGDNVTSMKNVRGGRGNDTLNASGEAGVNHSLSGGSGNDTLIGADLGDNISGGEGNDDITGNAGRDNIFGADGSDPNLNGGAGADQIHGGDGADVLRGETGNDRLYGNGSTGDTDRCIDPDPKTYRAGCESKS